MVSYLLHISSKDMDFGRKIWHKLRTVQAFPVKGAFWLFQSELNEWRLLIATPLFDEIGPKKAYSQLWEITQGMHADTDQVLRIVLISPSFPLYQALRTVFGKTKSVEGARLGNTQVGGMYIDDAYLYEIS
jgi:hypothetical protein